MYQAKRRSPTSIARAFASIWLVLALGIAACGDADDDVRALCQRAHGHAEPRLLQVGDGDGIDRLRDAVRDEFVRACVERGLAYAECVIDSRGEPLACTGDQ